MNSICPMNFFRTTDTTIWKPGFRYLIHLVTAISQITIVLSCYGPSRSEIRTIKQERKCSVIFIFYVIICFNTFNVLLRVL